MPNSDTLARQRLNGQRPYKVPASDGRRARWALSRVTVTRQEFARLRGQVVAVAMQVLSQIKVQPNRSDE